MLRLESSRSTSLFHTNRLEQDSLKRDKRVGKSSKAFIGDWNLETGEFEIRAMYHNVALEGETVCDCEVTQV